MTTSPAFIATTPAGIVSEMVSQFEAASGRTLYPAQVTATNTVTVRFQNETGGTIDLGSGTIRVRVRKVPNA